VDAKARYRQVAALHAANIDQGFLATLGIPFLSLMYRAIDEAQDSVLLTEECKGSVIGFVSGGVGMGPIYRRMLRRPLSLVWTLLPSLVRPAQVKRILDILRYGTQAGESLALPNAELLSIAVNPAVRGSGVAERLYHRLQGHFRDSVSPWAIHLARRTGSTFEWARYLHVVLRSMQGRNLRCMSSKCDATTLGAWLTRMLAVSLCLLAGVKARWACTPISQIESGFRARFMRKAWVRISAHFLRCNNRWVGPGAGKVRETVRGDGAKMGVAPVGAA
jgi:ribosomal protein S18 acetylase RimI-like enzyme